MTVITCPHGHTYGTCTMCYHDLVGEYQAQLADYETLKRAVNESTNECGPDCDGYSHGDQCPANDTSRWLTDQQKEIESLRAWKAEAERLLTYVVRYSNAKAMLSPGFIDDVQALFAGRRSAATEDALDAAQAEGL